MSRPYNSERRRGRPSSVVVGFACCQPPWRQRLWHMRMLLPTLCPENFHSGFRLVLANDADMYRLTSLARSNALERELISTIPPFSHGTAWALQNWQWQVFGNVFCGLFLCSAPVTSLLATLLFSSSRGLPAAHLTAETDRRKVVNICEDVRERTVPT